MMSKQRLKLLMIEDNPGDVRLLRETLLEMQDTSCELEHAGRLAAALQALSHAAYDAILLDLNLPDSHGLQTFTTLHEHAPDVPIMIVTDLNDESMAYHAIRSGAQDYLIKSEISARALARAIHNAIERARLAKDLQSSEARIRSITDNNADPLIVTDPQGMVLFANPAAETYFECSAEQWMGAPFGFPIVNGERSEIDVQRDDGQSAIAEMRIAPIEWAGQQAYLVSLRDITERRYAKEEMLRYTNKLLALQSASRAISSSLDIQNVLNTAVRQMAHLLSVETCVLSAWNRDNDTIVVLADFAPGGWWDQRPLKQFTPISEFPIAHTVIIDSYPRQITASQYPKDSYEFDFMREAQLKTLLMMPIVFQNRVLGIIELMDSHSERVFTDRDVSLAQLLTNQIGTAIEQAQLYTQAQAEIFERKLAEKALKLSEEKYRAVIEQSADGIFLVEADTLRILEANSALQHLLGYTADELISLKLYDIVAFDRATLDQLIKGILHNRNSRMYERKYCCKDGSLIDLEVSSHVIVYGNRDVLCVVGRDITERKRAEQALHEYTEELKTRNEELDAFSHSVAHDLKGPLTVITGYAEIYLSYRDTMAAQEIDQYMQDIAQTGRTMCNVIDELLLLSVVRQVDVEVQPLDMGIIVTNVHKRLNHMIDEYQAKLLLPHTWPIALGYGPALEEVWVNYISNAIKYGGRPPRIELGATLLENKRVKFWVRDNGNGLTPEEKSRLFTPFTRLNQVNIAGHGLGLSIVLRIVEKLGGEVSVESEPGHGSAFAFTLAQPAHTTATHASTNSSMASKTAGAEQQAFGQPEADSAHHR